MKKLVLFLLLFLIFPVTSKALSVSENNVTIAKGNSKLIDLYVNTEEEISSLSFDFTYSTYDVPALLTLDPSVTGNASGIRYNISFSTPVSGNIKIGTIKASVIDNPKGTSGTVNMTSVKGVTTSGSTIKLGSQEIVVNIGDETTVQEPVITNIEVPLLKSIESSIVSIKLKDNVYDYEVTIKEGIKELDLNPITKDSNSVVTIDTQKIDELSNNTIIIKVVNGDVSEEYKIKVNVKETKTTTKTENSKEENTPFKYKFKWVVLMILLVVMLFSGIKVNAIIKKH